MLLVGAPPHGVAVRPSCWAREFPGLSLLGLRPAGSSVHPSCEGPREFARFTLASFAPSQRNRFGRPPCPLSFGEGEKQERQRPYFRALGATGGRAGARCCPDPAFCGDACRVSTKCI